jgi:hypothetical protein
MAVSLRYYAVKIMKLGIPMKYFMGSFLEIGLPDRNFEEE